MTPKDLKELLRAFNEQKVKYLVVFAYRVCWYQRSRISFSIRAIRTSEILASRGHRRSASILVSPAIVIASIS
jgi:hypothetical protein